MSGAQGIVTFDYSIWGTTYPELVTSISAPQAETYFELACTVIDNSPTSLIPMNNGSGVPVRARILGAITAHLAAMFGAIDGEPPQQTVGRIQSATQGSVTVALDMGPQSQSAAWWNQTKYGAMAWMMLRAYRGARFFPAPRPYLGVGNAGGWGGQGGTSYRGNAG